MTISVPIKMMRSLTFLLLTLLLQHASAFQQHTVSCKLPTVVPQLQRTRRSSVQYLHRNRVAFRKNAPLFASEASEEDKPVDEIDDASEKKLAKKLAGRKKRVIMGYKAIMASYVALAGFVLIKGGISKFPLFFTFGNLSLPIGIAYVLMGAAKSDRLRSDTYKRLNLGLLQYGLLGGITVVIAASKQETNPLAYLPFVLSTINSMKGYAYGALGWDKKSSDSSLIQDFGGLIKTTNQAFIRKPKSVQSVCYLMAALLVGTLKITKAVEMAKIFKSGSGLPNLSPVLSQYNRLAFLTIAMVTLKDACDRDRLSGTTFIQINYLGGLIMAANSAFMGGLTTSMGATAAVLSLFLTLSGLSSYFEKSKA
mmetsp:Transcript_15739/g.38766  ORF Transcript_15739/g.38766 Transcript_15739/m.38766 type:complete len:367 (+) Transcript_15739:35-1135(+)